MTTVIETKSEKLPPPPEGIVDAVCIEIEDKGTMETQWGPKHKVRIIWEIEEVKQDGTKFKIAKWYNMSLHPWSRLRQDLASWRGRDLSEEEEKRFDLDTLVGMACQLDLVHESGKDGNTYARAEKVLPPTADESREAVAA